MWTRRFVSVLLAMTLALGAIAMPRQASAIDDNWGFLDPPMENAGDPDTPGATRRMETFRALGQIRIQAQVRVAGIPTIQVFFLNFLIASARAR